MNTMTLDISSANISLALPSMSLSYVSLPRCCFPDTLVFLNHTCASAACGGILSQSVDEALTGADAL
jgi:hypothetical protein